MRYGLGITALLHLREAKLQAQDCCGQAALHDPHVVLPGRSLSLGRARQGVGHDKGDASRQRHILRVQVLQQAHALSGHVSTHSCCAVLPGV